MVAWQALSSALQTFSHGQLMRACRGLPVSAAFISALDLLACCPPAQHLPV